MDAAGAGLGLIVVFGALTIFGIAISGVYLVVPKDTVGRCADAQLAAVIAFFIGDLIPLLAIIEVIRQGVGDDFNKLLALISGSALFINSTLAIVVFIVARHRGGKLTSSGGDRA
jgi:hypothetical protein